MCTADSCLRLAGSDLGRQLEIAPRPQQGRQFTVELILKLQDCVSQ